jgi:hypothetical protein
MELNLYLDSHSSSYKIDSAAFAKVHDFQANTWVNFLEIPNPYSFDQALLLCQISNHEWLAWIPDHGEAVLYTWQIKS